MATTRKPSTAGGATRVSVAATAMMALRKMSLLSELDEEDLGGGAAVEDGAAAAAELARRGFARPFVRKNVRVQTL